MFVALAVGIGVNVAVAVAVGVSEAVTVIVGVTVLVGVLVFVAVGVFVIVGAAVLNNPPKLLSIASHPNKASKRRMNKIITITFGFIIITPHAHACDGYRAYDRAHVPRRGVHAHANGLHLRLRHRARARGHRVYGCAREIKPYAHVNVHVVH